MNSKENAEDYTPNVSVKKGWKEGTHKVEFYIGSQGFTLTPFEGIGVRSSEDRAEWNAKMLRNAFDNLTKQLREENERQRTLIDGIYNFSHDDRAGSILSYLESNDKDDPV